LTLKYTRPMIDGCMSLWNISRGNGDAVFRQTDISK
jgi:hypothetical protein